jgi:predicted GNAT family N-acyltransferase
MQFTIHLVTWQTHAEQLRSVRETVFIKEQKVPVALEWDGLDDTALHLLALTHEGEAIGCARLLGEGSIGRMAVIKSWRNQGVGMALLQRSITHYQQNGISKIRLSAQTHAIKFYEKAGFKVCSAPYLDAGIWHVDMQLGT